MDVLSIAVAVVSVILTLAAVTFAVVIVNKHLQYRNGIQSLLHRIELSVANGTFDRGEIARWRDFLVAMLKVELNSVSKDVIAELEQRIKEL